jgi:hypothetical protein
MPFILDDLNHHKSFQGQLHACANYWASPSQEPPVEQGGDDCRAKDDA